MKKKQREISGPRTKRCFLIIPEAITRRNLEFSALSNGINVNLFEIETLQSLANRVLEQSGKHGSDVLARDELEALIIDTTVSMITEGIHSDLLQGLQLQDKDTLDIFTREFIWYLRSTNDTELHNEITEIAVSTKDAFAREVSLSFLDVFKIMRSRLEVSAKRVYGDQIFLTRYDLFRNATDLIESSERLDFKEVEIGIAALPIFDAAALRFLTALSARFNCTITLFCANRVYGNVAKRLRAAGIDFTEGSSGNTISPLCPNSASVMNVIQDDPPELVALPDKRREVLLLAERISDLLKQGVQPFEILVAARDTGKYLPFISDIFPAFGIPYHVQTKHAIALLSEAQLVSSVLELLSKVSTDSEIDWNTLTDPVRLGFCIAGKKGWPMSSRAFVYLEEELASVQAGHKKALKFFEWVAEISSLGWEDPRNRLLEFTEWVTKHSQQPRTALDGTTLIRKLLHTYMRQQSVWRRKSLDPRVTNPARFQLTEWHPTENARRVIGKIRDLNRYLAFHTTLRGSSAVTWEVILAAYISTVLTSNYRIPNQDIQSIRFVDVGTSWFLHSEYLFILGLASEEFPRKSPEGRFLHQELRKEIAKIKKGRAAFLYIIGPSTDYDREFDYLQTALMIPSKHLVCTTSYLDEGGHKKEWSPFVEHLAALEKRVLPDQWLPCKETDWKKQVDQYPPWIKWRLFSFHQHRAVLPSSLDKVSDAELKVLAEFIHPSNYVDGIQPRIERYLRPPSSVRISGKEECFTVLPLHDICGEPFRTSEMDLHSLCPLQFYFYQFLFVWDVGKIDRGKIPPISTRRSHWKFGLLPRRLSYYYPNSETEEAIESVLAGITDRQKSLSRLSSEELTKTLSGLLNSFDLLKLQAHVEAERTLVVQEIGDRISRNWSWVAGGNAATVNNEEGESVKVVLPSHRLDKLRESSLVIVYVNYSGQIENIAYENQVRAGRSYPQPVSDPLLDYRIATLLVHYSKNLKLRLAGGLYASLYENDRHGYYHQQWITQHKGPTGYREELAMPLPDNTNSLRQVFDQSAWRRRIDEFATAIIQRGLAMRPSESGVTYEATPSPETCGQCVYSKLCQIPRANGW